MLWVAMVAATVSQVGCGSKDGGEAAKGSTSPTNSTANVATPGPASAAVTGGAIGAPAGVAPGGVAASAPAGDGMIPLHSLNLANPTKPEEVVGAFLEGMRTGNATVIESLLSTRARQEIKAKELVIAPIGSPQAQFEIGKAEFADPKDPNTVLVPSNWLEPGANGQIAGDYEVVWALVKEPTGWRICEMAVDTHQPGEEVQVVNFENLTEVASQSEAPRTAALPNAGTTAPPPASGGVPALPVSGSNGLPGTVPSGVPAGVPAVPGSNPSGLPSAGGVGLPPVNAPAGGAVPPPGIPAGAGSAPASLPPVSSGNFSLPPGSGAPPLRQK